MELTPVVERDRRQPRRLGFADAVERGRDPALGGDDVGTAFEQLRRQAAGTAPGCPAAAA